MAGRLSPVIPFFPPLFGFMASLMYLFLSNLLFCRCVLVGRKSPREGLIAHSLNICLLRLSVSMRCPACNVVIFVLGSAFMHICSTLFSIL